MYLYASSFFLLARLSRMLDEILNYPLKCLPLLDLLVRPLLPKCKYRICNPLKILQSFYVRLELRISHAVQRLIRRRT